MSTITKVLRNFQITIPAEVREKISLHEGDLIDFEITDDGILLKPMETIEKSQAWFWSAKWQKEEILAEKDFKKGKVVESKDVGSLLKDLDSK